MKLKFSFVPNKNIFCWVQFHNCIHNDKNQANCDTPATFSLRFQMASRMREQKIFALQISGEPNLKAFVGGMKTQLLLRRNNALLLRIMLCTQQKIVLLGTIN